MDIRKLQKIVVSALEDIKGEDIEVINTVKLTSLFDRIIIATGTSNRQVKALANNVVVKVKEAGGEVVSSEGEEGGEWVLVDLGDIVVHVMLANVRAYYNLEELWRAKPAAKRSKVEAVEEGDEEKKPAPKRARTTKASPEKTAAPAAAKVTPARRRKAPAAE